MTNNYTSEELIKCIYYLSSVDILTEIKNVAELGIEQGKTLEDFKNLLPKIVDEQYIQLQPVNIMLIKNIYDKIWKMLTAKTQDEFINFVKSHSADFDICTKAMDPNK